MVELTGKEKLVAIEIIKIIKERICNDCKKELEKIALEIIYS